jgi:hypothetical protein
MEKKIKEKAGSCWWSHDWSKWKIIEEGETISTITKATIGKYFYQRRECLRCGKVEIEKEDTLL